MDWDKEKLKQDIEELPDDYKINYSELARQYHVCESTGKTTANGGQIVKEWLLSQGKTSN